MQNNSLNGIQEIMQETAQETAQETVQENVQESMQKTVQENMQKTVQKTVQENMQKTVQENVQESMQENVQRNTQVNLQNNVQNEEKDSEQKQQEQKLQEQKLQEQKLQEQKPQIQKPQTRQSVIMKENFPFFGAGSLLLAIFYSFCMYRNPSGVTFPFFIAASLFYLCYALSKLGLTLKKGSGFYIASIMLLAVSTFATDDSRIIFFNKAGIFLLMMSLLLQQFYDTNAWKLSQYLSNIVRLFFGSFTEMNSSAKSAACFFQKNKSNKGTSIGYVYVFIGLVIAGPILIVIIALLADADVVFRQLTNAIYEGLCLSNIGCILFQIVVIFLLSYNLVAYLCRHTLREEAKDCRKGEPILAITVTGLLSVVYLVFSVIQIVYLFCGKMQLPDGYTYSQYAREGFFQLLTVSFLNLLIVLICINLFKDSKILRLVLTVMSGCTFIMIASSAMRMIIYIRFYYLTFLRILVLWALLVLLVLFIGIMISIYKPNFPLFRYGVAAVTILYLVLSFSHPDYVIASVNVSNAGQIHNSFFLTDESYHDNRYLKQLCADAAPIVIPYFEQNNIDWKPYSGRELTSSIRSFNISRYMASRHLR